MERPFFSLAKKPRYKPIEYQVGDVWVEVSANPKFGMATIWDADILIWASTQITEALDRGLKPSRTIQFPPLQPAQGDPPRDRRRALPAAARGPGAADPHRRPHQHPGAGQEEGGVLPLAGELDRGDRREHRARPPA